MNLLFFRKSLSSPFNEVDNDLGDGVETLDEHEVNLVASFNSTNRVVEDIDEERSGLDLEDGRDRPFRDEKVEGGRSTLDSLLDGDESRLGNLEGKEGYSKVVNSCFETKEMTLLLGVE